jgi:Tol biopolymer transport system component
MRLRSWTTKNEIVYSSVQTTPGTSPNEAPTVLFRVPATGGESRKILTLPPFSDFHRIGNTTPDGSAIVAVNEEHLALFDLATGMERILSIELGAWHPQLSPDGRLLAFLLRRDGAWGVFAAAMEQLPIREPVHVANLRHRGATTPDGRLRWLPKGILTFDYQGTESNLYRIDVDATTARALRSPVRLTRNIDASAPIVSPDSQEILFVAPSRAPRLDPDNGIFAIRADGSGERRVADRPLISGGLPFPDPAAGWIRANEIVYATPDRPELLAKNLRTGEQAHLPRSDRLSCCGPAANGSLVDFEFVPSLNAVVYRGFDPVRQQPAIRLRRLDDGVERVLIASMPASWRVSRDGRRVAFWVVMPTGPGSSKEELHVMNLDGTQDRIVTTKPFDAGSRTLAWGPRGHLLYLDRGPQLADLDSNRSWPLVDSPLADAAAGESLGGFDWSPDGTFIVFAKTTQSTARLGWEGVTYDAIVKLSRQTHIASATSKWTSPGVSREGPDVTLRSRRSSSRSSRR